MFLEKNIKPNIFLYLLSYANEGISKYYFGLYLYNIK